MLISRSPLRISLGGGGTDLPSYYKKKGGFLISAAINKYVYVTITRPFKEGVYLKYSKIENVKKISHIRHPIVRELFKFMKIKKPQIEITTLTDIPAGTGLIHAADTMVGSQVEYDRLMQLKEEAANAPDEQEVVVEATTSEE